ncbi:DegT/DnrJ/EryC1/StrS family aminotransferase [bacterium]|nr:DegT/DnrJ/EryC1/StrS family aminotransferase [bacterium]
MLNYYYREVEEKVIMIPILDSKRQYAQIGKEIEKEVLEVLASGSYILGKHNKALQEEFANFVGSKFSLGLNSGTDALHLALRALNIGRGDEVITTAFTFVATASAIGLAGATPVFVEINEETFNIDPEKIEAAITPKTKAIIPVHLYGQPAEMDKIMEIAKRHNLRVIEDCCQAIGAQYKGQQVGTFGDFGCFSFYPTKNLGGMGDGGMITCNDETLFNRIVALRNHGGAIRYYHDELGVNSRLDEIQAAIIRVKLNYIKEWNEKRRANAYRYNEMFAKYPEIQTPKEIDDSYCVYHQYTIKIENRDEVHKLLLEKGIGAMIYYPVPLHLQKLHKELGYKVGDLPKTEKDTTLVMSLPMFPELTVEEQQTVVNTVVECLNLTKQTV